jgi:tetratricopeptide (TPR) repeat protein
VSDNNGVGASTGPNEVGGRSVDRPDGAFGAAISGVGADATDAHVRPGDSSPREARSADVDGGGRGSLRRHPAREAPNQSTAADQPAERSADRPADRSAEGVGVARLEAEGVGVARLEAEGELALAWIALYAGDPARAAGHLASGLAADPTRAAAYDLLGELDSDLIPARDYFPLTEPAEPGSIAARSYLAARAGRYNDALTLLARVASREPAKTWTAAGWLDMPGTAEQIDPADGAEALLFLALRLDEPVDHDLLSTLWPYLDFARRLIDAHRDRPDILAPMSGLARRLGAVDEAIAWCEYAERVAPSARTAIMLGYAYRAVGRVDDMIATWVTAVERAPTNVDIQVDLAEHLDRTGRHDEALSWLERAVSLDPTHPKAVPSAYEMRFRADGDAAHLIRLVDHWRTYPEHSYADDRLAKASDGRPWLRFVPAEPVALGNRPAGLHAHRQPRGARHIRRNATAPPLTALPPSGRAVATLHDVASAVWLHPVGAYDRAAGLSAVPLDDLLALIEYTPAPRDDGWQRVHRLDPAYWPKFARTFVCLGLLHHRVDQSWSSSDRRRVLVDLVERDHGRPDTVEAAMFALIVGAWMDPGARPDVARVIDRRFASLRRAARRSPAGESLASLVLLTPGVDPIVRRDAQRILGTVGNGHRRTPAARAVPAAPVSGPAAGVRGPAAGVSGPAEPVSGSSRQPWRPLRGRLRTRRSDR